MDGFLTTPNGIGFDLAREKSMQAHLVSSWL
jgi:hypothetical protein